MARLSREESREQTRSRLLDAARETFARAGYGCASVDAIAEAAGYSKGAVYSNFETKEAIFLELLQRHMQSELEASRDLVARGDTVEAIIDRIAHRYATDQQDTDWCLLSVEFALHAARSPVFAAQHAALYDKHFEGIAQIIRRVAKIAGRKVRDPQTAAAKFVALRQGLAIDRSAPRPRLSEQDVKSALRQFMFGLLGLNA